MWFAPIVTVAPTLEPVTVDQVKEFCRIDGNAFDAQIGIYIAGVRSEIEAITGTRLAPQTVKIQAEAFSDLDVLPVAPATSITSITYRNRDGEDVALDAARYALVGAELEWGIRPAGAWPNDQARESLIEVVAVVGYDAPPERVVLAILLAVRAAMVDGQPFDLAPLLVNDRLYG